MAPIRPRTALLLTAALFVAFSAFPAPPTKPNDREWGLITADYQWLETPRKAQAQPQAGSSRKEMIETELANLEQLQPALNAFDTKARADYDLPPAPPSAQLITRAK